MRLKFFAFIFSAIAVLAIGQPAQAAISLLFNNTINQLEDNDFESLSVAGDTRIEEGDILVGMISIQQVRNFLAPANVNVATTDTFTAVFFVKVQAGGITVQPPAADPVTNTAFFQLEALSNADYAALQVLYPALPNRNSSSTTTIVFDDNDGPTFINPDVGTVNTSLATAADGTLLWEFGLTGAPGTGQSAKVTVFDPADPQSIVLGSSATLNFSGGLNLTHTYAAGATVLFNPLTLPTVFNQQTGVPYLAQLLFNGTNDPGNPGDFQVATDTDLFILPSIVPEPGSMLIWAGMGLAGVFAARRRRNLAV